MKIGTMFTLGSLVQYSIQNSDNTAYKMLRSVVSEDGYIDFTKELGIEHSEDLRYCGTEMICTESARIYGETIYQFIEEGNKYSSKLKTYMMNTTNPMIVADAPIARKYGWADLSFHDLAIVYGERPYLLSILTDFEDGDASDYKVFKDISRLVEKYSN